jgi:ATP-dependent DNA ligase
MIGDVEYRSHTTEGYLRHSSWKGLRYDKTLGDLEAVERVNVSARWASRRGDVCRPRLAVG